MSFAPCFEKFRLGTAAPEEIQPWLYNMHALEILVCKCQQVLM